MDLVEVEVLQGEAVAREQPRDGVRRRHQQPLVPVHEVDGGGLVVDQERQRLEPAFGGPVLRGEQDGGRTVRERRGVAGRHRRALALAEDRLELGERLDRRVGTQVLVALQPAERRELVVEEALVVRRGQVLVGRSRELVLVLAGDPPLQRGQGGVLAHRHLRPGLAVLRDGQPDVARTDLGQSGQLALGVAGGVDLHQLLAQLVADRDRSIGRGVGATGDPDLDGAERDLVGHDRRGLQTGAAGLLEVGGGRLGCELGAQHGLSGQVEVTGVLEDGAGHHLAHPLALDPEAGDEPVDRRGQHLLVGGVDVDTVGPGEREAVAAEHGDATGLLVHTAHPDRSCVDHQCNERHVTKCGR